MSKIRLMLAALACAFTAFAAPEIQFLPYFDSLNAYRGKAGHWFVRDAAGTSTGQHGDPTVLKGWAMYTWNALRSDGKAGWTKICEEESLDSSATEALLREYVKRDDFNAAMEAISKTYTTLDKHNTDVNALKSVCQSLKVTVQTMESDLTDVKSDVSKVITVVRKVSNDLAAHETWAKAASNNVLTAAMKYTDEKTKGGGGGGVDTNAVKAIAGAMDTVVSNALDIAKADKEYSAYEVWPHASDGNLKERFYIRTTVAELKTIHCSDGQIDLAVPKASNRCYIDWGDGSAITYIKDLPDFSTMTTNLASKIYRKDEWISGQDWVAYVAVEHTYPAVDDKKYIIKVGGHDFFCIYKHTLDASYPMSSMTSRIFDNDLPIAHNHNNVIYFGGHSPYLTKVHFPHGFDAPWIKNWTGVFMDCKNLKEVLNIDVATRNAKNVGIIFKGCSALESTDFRINGHNIYSTSGIFEGCENLEADLLSLLPDGGFADQYVNLSTCFKDCKKLYIGKSSTNKVAQILWCNNLTQWTSTSCFAGCSPELRSVIPTTWGGTAKDIIASTAKGATVINNYPTYPNRVKGAFNVALGIDNEVGFGSSDPKYSVAIGTSSKAAKMHSYAWGSQINALENNTTVMGYGLSATNEWSTIVGHGIRPTGMVFDNKASMVAWLSDSANKDKLYVDMGFLLSNGPGSTYGITDVYMVPDPTTGMYCKLEENPPDYKMGGHSWAYGKSHGPGTFNIVAVKSSDTKSRGLKAVFINDDDYYNLIFNSTDNPLRYFKCGFEQLYTNTNSVTGAINKNLKDYRIIIGQNAVADGKDGDHCQSVAIGRDAETHGSASVAVGPNTEVDEGGFGVALGWRAIAAGEGGIAVGMGYKSSTNFWLDAKHQQRNPVADYTAAVAPKSIAIGRSAVVEKNATKGIAIGDRAHVDAVGSVQIGYGTNTTANSLRFQNVDVVKDGKVCGTFDSKDLDPKEVDVSEGAQTEEIVMKVTPHIINTLASTNVCGPGTEVYVESTGSRNYEIYVPNTKEFREGLPMTFETEIADCKAVFVNGKNTFKLPCLIKVQQPTKNNVLFTAVEVDDGMDWTPAITNCNIYFDVMAGKFMTKKVGSTSYSLQGTSLQAGTEYKVEYPISATATWTNDFETVSAQQKFLSGTFYSNVSSVELTPTKQVHFTSDTSWFKIHYTTVNGKANVIQKTITIE